jgi:hypothetical protein
MGATASVAQSLLFVIIGVAALVLGVDRLVDNGFASLSTAKPVAFKALCAAFVLIAALGVAITPAERASIESASPGWATFGSNLAYLGHAGTIAYFSWWLLRAVAGDAGEPVDDTVAPLEWGLMFELVLVGAWVWIIAGVIRDDPRWPRGFFALSVFKAVSFWFAFAAVLANQTWALVVGLGTVTFVTGPIWHLWVARLLVDRAGDGTR